MILCQKTVSQNTESDCMKDVFKVCTRCYCKRLTERRACTYKKNYFMLHESLELAARNASQG